MIIIDQLKDLLTSLKSLIITNPKLSMIILLLLLIIIYNSYFLFQIISSEITSQLHYLKTRIDIMNEYVEDDDDSDESKKKTNWGQIITTILFIIITIFITAFVIKKFS